MCCVFMSAAQPPARPAPSPACGGFARPHLKDQYELDVVDIYQNPAATRQDQIVAAPTLVKLLPAPLRRLIGDLSDRERVLAGLDIVPRAGPTE